MEKGFYYRVYELVAKIPFGKVTTYGSIAKAIGLRSSARLVGNACRAAAGTNSLPFHRVVNRSGELTGKHSFPDANYMRQALEAEGVKFIGEHVDMDNFFWDAEI